MQLILTTPPNIVVDAFVPQLEAALQTGDVSALVICRYELSDQDYADLVGALAPVAQQNECAVLLDNLPEKVAEWNTDGVHMTSGQTKFARALEQLKPDYIVGAGDLGNRHEIMLRAEAGADYVLFGTFEEAPTEQQLEMANWSVEMLEVPTALADPTTSLAELDQTDAEFIALGENLWQQSQDGTQHSAENLAKAIKALVQRQSDGT